MNYNKLNVLFVHNGPLHQDSNGRYFGVMLNDSLRRRYLTMGDHVSFLMRKRCVKTGAGQLSPIETDSFSFIELPEIMTFKGRLKNHATANAIIKNTVLNHDIIIIRLPSAAGNIALSHCARMGKPYMVEFVACGFDALWNYNWKGKLIAPLMFLLQKRRMRKVPFVVYVTQHFLQKRYPCSGRQVCISDVELDNVSSINLERRLIMIEKLRERKRIVLGTVAALDVPYKGQADVIKAIAKLKAEGILADYRLVGCGSPSRLLELTARLGLEDQVMIVGAVPHAEVFNQLESIDIYVQPSRQEGLPRAVIEAMSMACPVIGAATGGIPELIDSSRIFSKKSVAQIATLIKLLSNQDEMRRDATRNFHEAKKYAKIHLEEQRQQFYNEFLGCHHLQRPNVDREVSTVSS